MGPGELLELELRFLETPYEGLRIRDRKLERALLISLEETGQQFPITVIPSGRPGFYVVIDGYRRVRGLRKLGRDVVRAQVLRLSAGEALLWVRVGQATAPLTALEQGLLIRELVECQEISLDTIALRTGRSKSWVSRRLDLVQVLPESVQRMVVAGQIPPSSAMKVLVPVARANSDHAQILARAIAEGKLSTREVELLYTHYRSPSPEIREALLASPLKFLRAEEAYRSSHDGPDTEEHDVLERLERLTALAAATTTRVRRLLRAGTESPPMRRLAPACALAWQAVEALRGVLAPMIKNEEGGCDDRSREETSGLPLQGGGEGNALDRASGRSGSQHGSTDPAGGSGGACPGLTPAQAGGVSGADPGAVQPVRAESGSSRRGAREGDGDAGGLLDAHGLLPPQSAGSASRGEAAVWPVPLRAGG
jgi:ParB family chromosome partitioning protein